MDQISSLLLLRILNRLFCLKSQFLSSAFELSVICFHHCPSSIIFYLPYKSSPRLTLVFSHSPSFPSFLNLFFLKYILSNCLFESHWMFCPSIHPPSIRQSLIPGAVDKKWQGQNPGPILKVLMVYLGRTDWRTNTILAHFNKCSGKKLHLEQGWHMKLSHPTIWYFIAVIYISHCSLHWSVILTVLFELFLRGLWPLKLGTWMNQRVI